MRAAYKNRFASRNAAEKLEDERVLLGTTCISGASLANRGSFQLFKAYIPIELVKYRKIE